MSDTVIEAPNLPSHGLVLTDGFTSAAVIDDGSQTDRGPLSRNDYDLFFVGAQQRHDAL